MSFKKLYRLDDDVKKVVQLFLAIEDTGVHLVRFVYEEKNSRLSLDVEAPLTIGNLHKLEQDIPEFISHVSRGGEYTIRLDEDIYMKSQVFLTFKNNEGIFLEYYDKNYADILMPSFKLELTLENLEKLPRAIGLLLHYLPKSHGGEGSENIKWDSEPVCVDGFCRAKEDDVYMTRIGADDEWRGENNS